MLRDTKRCSQVSRFCCQSGSDNKIETGAIKFESTVGKIEIGDRKFDAIVLKEKTAIDCTASPDSKTNTPVTNPLSPIPNK